MHASLKISCFFAFGRLQRCPPKAWKALFDTAPPPYFIEIGSKKASSKDKRRHGMCVCYQFVFRSHMPIVNVMVKL
jgi:hypothetical protein